MAGLAEDAVTLAHDKSPLAGELDVESGRTKVLRQETTEPRGLGHRALHGLILLLAQNVVARIAGLLSQLALAALLRPEDFGLIGLASSITNIAQAVTNVGVEDVLLQRRNTIALWSGPAFWIMLTLLSITGASVAALSPYAASLFKAPGMVGLLLVSAVSMPINAFAVAPGALLRARLRFRFLAGWGVFEALATSSLTVIFAWAGWGAYSFVLPLPIMATLRAVVWAYAARSIMPLDFKIKLGRWRYLVGNSAVTFATKLVNSIMGQGDYIILGFLASEAAVGRYYFGFRLAAQPLWILAGNFNGVMLPALVHLKDDPVRQGQAVLRASTLLSYCVMPLAFTQAAIAAPLIKFFFANRWVGSIPIIQLLSAGLAFDAVSWVAGGLLTARGEYMARLRNQLFQVPIFVTLVTIGTLLYGAVGTSLGVCLHYLITQPPFVWSVYRRIGLTGPQVAAIYIKPTFYASISVALGLLAANLFLSHWAQIARVFVISTVATLTYVGLLRWKEPAVWMEVSSRFTSVIRRA